MAGRHSIRDPKTGRMAAVHGLTNTITYVSWEAMNQRCYDRKSINYRRYGGRGVMVCQRWRESFPSFLADMGERPSLAHSLDRIDNNGPYEPGNCRWATDKQQSRNRANNRLLTYKGETRCVMEWAEILGLSKHTIFNRLREGWAVERIMTTPQQKKTRGVSSA